MSWRRKVETSQPNEYSSSKASSSSVHILPRELEPVERIVLSAFFGGRLDRYSRAHAGGQATGQDYSSVGRNLRQRASPGKAGQNERKDSTSRPSAGYGTSKVMFSLRMSRGGRVSQAAEVEGMHALQSPPSRTPRRPLSRGAGISMTRRRMAAANDSCHSLPSVMLATAISSGAMGGDAVNAGTRPGPWQPSMDSLENWHEIPSSPMRTALGTPASRMPPLVGSLRSRLGDLDRGPGDRSDGGGGADGGLGGGELHDSVGIFGLDSVAEQPSQFRSGEIGTAGWAPAPDRGRSRSAVQSGRSLAVGSKQHAAAMLSDSRYARDAIARARAIVGLSEASMGLDGDSSVLKGTEEGSTIGRLAYARPGQAIVTARGQVRSKGVLDKAGFPADGSSRPSTSPAKALRRPPGGARSLQQLHGPATVRRSSNANGVAKTPRMRRPQSVAASRASEGAFLDAHDDPNAFIRTAMSPMQRPSTAGPSSRLRRLQQHQPKLEETWRSNRPRTHGLLPRSKRLTGRRSSASSHPLHVNLSSAARAALADDDEDEMAVARYVAAARRRRCAQRIHEWTRRVIARRRWRRVANRRFELVARPVFKAWSQHAFMRRFLVSWRAKKVFARWKFYYLERKATYRMVLNVGLSEALDRQREARRVAMRHQQQLLGSLNGNAVDSEQGSSATSMEGDLAGAKAISIDRQAIRLQLACRLVLAASADEWFDEPLGEVQGRQRGAIAARPARGGRRASLGGTFKYRPPWWMPGLHLHQPDLGPSVGRASHPESEQVPAHAAHGQEQPQAGQPDVQMPERIGNEPSAGAEGPGTQAGEPSLSRAAAAPESLHSRSVGFESEAVGKELGLSTKPSVVAGQHIESDSSSSDSDNDQGRGGVWGVKRRGRAGGLLGALAKVVSYETNEARQQRLDAARRRSWIREKLHSAAVRVAQAPADLLSAASHIYAGESPDGTIANNLFDQVRGGGASASLPRNQSGQAGGDSQVESERTGPDEDNDKSEAEDEISKAGGYLLMEAKQSQRAHLAATPEDSDLHPLALGLGAPPCVRAASLAVSCAEQAVRAATGGAYGIQTLPRHPGATVIPPAATHSLYDLLETASSDACRRLTRRVWRPGIKAHSTAARDRHLDGIANKVPTPHAPVLLRRSLGQIATHLKKRFMLCIKAEAADRRALRSKGVAALRAAFGGIMKKRNLVFSGLLEQHKQHSGGLVGAQDGKDTADSKERSRRGGRGEPILLPDGRILWPSQVKGLCFELWMRSTVAKREVRLGRPVPTFRERRRLPEWEEFLRKSRQQAAARVEAQATERGRVMQAVMDHWSGPFLEDQKKMKMKNRFIERLARRARQRRVFVWLRRAFLRGELS